jgi:hypothetical protein
VTWEIHLPFQKKLQTDEQESSDFFVLCSGIEILLYSPYKPHPDAFHCNVLHVNAMGKLPGTDTPDNH